MTFGRGADRKPGFARVDDTARCPCGTGESYGGCCAPLHRGEPAPSAERLMRSRYTAFVVGDADYLSASWHASTRPETLELDPSVRWSGLEILDAGEDGDRAVVEFRALFRAEGRDGEQRERSRFLRRRGRWSYLDGAG